VVFFLELPATPGIEPPEQGVPVHLDAEIQGRTHDAAKLGDGTIEIREGRVEAAGICQLVQSHRLSSGRSHFNRPLQL